VYVLGSERTADRDDWIGGGLSDLSKLLSELSELEGMAGVGCLILYCKGSHPSLGHLVQIGHLRARGGEGGGEAEEAGGEEGLAEVGCLILYCRGCHSLGHLVQIEHLRARGGEVEEAGGGLEASPFPHDPLSMKIGYHSHCLIRDQ
jgi:hypothetical protein